MEVKKIKRVFKIDTYSIIFTYSTVKGYYREQIRILHGFNEEEVKDFFKNWAKKQRTMTNVKILVIEKIKETTKEFEI